MEIRKEMLVGWPAHAMFDLIEQAENYPAFLPWCASATILERSDDMVAAALAVDYRGVKFGFSTRNPKRRPEWLQVQLVSGPFRRFEGEWQLVPLGDAGCRVVFMLRYEFDSTVMQRLASPVFDRIADTLLDALVAHADRRFAVTPPVPVPATPVPPTRGRRRARRLPFPRAFDQEPRMTTDERYAALRGTRLAAELSDEQCRRLADLIVLTDVAEGQVLVHEGTSDSHLYVVIKGVMGVVKSHGAADALTLNTLSAGDFAGELRLPRRHGAVRVAGRAVRRPGHRHHARAPGVGAEERPGTRLPGDARDRPRDAPDPAPPGDAADRAVELHLQAARQVLRPIGGRPAGRGRIRPPPARRGSGSRRSPWRHRHRTCWHQAR